MMFAGDTPAQIKNNQEAFFNTLPKVVYANCSFNGSRSVRIAGNYFELNLNGYNYCKIEHIRRGTEYTFYSFIDLYRYVNDECCEIDITCDYIQTYLSEIKLAAPFIDQRNYSLNADLYKTPYHNFYPVSRMVESGDKVELSSIRCVVFLVAPNQEDEASIFGASPVSIPFDIKTRDISTAVGVHLVCYPIDENDNIIYDVIDMNNQTVHLINMYAFMENYSGIIIDSGICEHFNIVIRGGDNKYHLNYTSGGYFEIGEIDADNKLLLAISDSSNNTGKQGFGELFTLIDSKYLSALNISPYTEYRVGRRTSYFTINPYNKGKNDNKIDLIVKSDVLGEKNNIVQYQDINRYETISTYKNPCGYMLYSRDAWSSYKNAHTATVGDSLATKHKYDLEIAERNKQAGTNKTTANAIGDAIKTFTGYLEDALSSVASILTGGSNIKIPITGIINRTTDIGVNTYKSVTDITVAYENAKTNIQKEKDLLELEYNNIRNAPNEVLNAESNSYYHLYETASAIVVKADNMEQIKKYHKKFGFQTSLQSDSDMTLSQLHDKAARHFDYIVTKNASVISENIPKSAAANIEKIFDNGIYLWRDYNKLGEDYFSNYNGE